MADVGIMGIVNVTPDSFGGLMNDAGAIRRGLELVEAGASIIDVGGESAGPGRTPVSTAEEIRRIKPVVQALAARSVVVSVDTTRLEVAQAAADVGAAIINDIWGLQRAPELARLAAQRELGLVITHNQEHASYS